jgi:cytoplasmic iron level regulating protein YaaA (DUF328/UPF0246 family)
VLTVISPAKRLANPPTPLPEGLTPSKPVFMADANRLARIARALTANDLRSLMDISEPLARLNAERFRSFRTRPTSAGLHPAALVFAGDTYIGLEAKTLDPDALRWAQDHLRILSGLYGLLRPFDAIQPYRLEMGSRLAYPKGVTLYAFWGERLARGLTEQAKAVGTDTLVNCASQEYFRAVDPKALKLRVITPVFLEEKANGARVVSFFAKQARGAMARFIAEHRLTDPSDLVRFDSGGYRHHPALSAPDRPVFIRRAIT